MLAGKLLMGQTGPARWSISGDLAAPLRRLLATMKPTLPLSRSTRQWRPTPLAWALWLALSAGLPGLAMAACVDEDKPDPAAATVVAPAAPSASPKPSQSPVLALAQEPAPRRQLQTLVQDAVLRSNGIGAARLLAEAADQDVEEARAAKKPMAALTGSVNPSLTGGSGPESSALLQARAGVSLSQTWFDGGRGDRIVDWRRQQAEAARMGLLSTQEQIALTTISLAFERSRYRMQATIYGQQVRKMGCLVEALDTIVSADKGRTSELVQARKQLQQAELQQAQTASQARQVEAKLRRIVGDGLPGTEGMSTLLLVVPELPDVLAAAERSVEIGQLDANAAALREMARAVEASGKPQVGWSLGGSAALGTGASSNRNASLSAGVTLSIPLMNAGIDHSIQAARKRAEAARLQRSEVLELRRQRIVEAHEQVMAAFDRLRRVGLVLRDSDRLRNFTLQQWQQLGRRSLFDVIGAENDHYNLRVQYVNALHDGQQTNATLLSLGTGLAGWLQ